MDDLDRAIINELQVGIAICERPFAALADGFGINEAEMIGRLQDLLDDGMLSRFGPMYHAEKLGGGLTLAALKVPQADFERVTALVNAHPEVAHNYARDHDLNMWFVVATDDPGRVDSVLAEIERESGLRVFNFPKREEFYVGLRLAV